MKIIKINTQELYAKSSNTIYIIEDNAKNRQTLDELRDAINYIKLYDDYGDIRVFSKEKLETIEEPFLTELVIASVLADTFGDSIIDLIQSVLTPLMVVNK